LKPLIVIQGPGVSQRDERHCRLFFARYLQGGGLPCRRRVVSFRSGRVRSDRRREGRPGTRWFYDAGADYRRSWRAGSERESDCVELLLRLKRVGLKRVSNHRAGEYQESPGRAVDSTACSNAALCVRSKPRA